MSAQVETKAGSGQMFDKIAEKYDMLNRVLSLGMDKSWRKILINALQLEGNAKCLDVATGTADVAIAVANHYESSTVIGLDPSVGMLHVGQTKIDNAALSQRVELIEGDGQALPFPDNSFDACCISFGIRNVPDRALGLKEMARVTRPGGRVAILELGTPTEGWIAPFARFHINTVVPKVGAWLSSAPEYAYLQKSIQAFPTPQEFEALMQQAGLVNTSITRMPFDAAQLYVGEATD